MELCNWAKTVEAPINVTKMPKMPARLPTEGWLSALSMIALAVLPAPSPASNPIWPTNDCSAPNPRKELAQTVKTIKGANDKSV
jgi:hypothetical protein